VIWSTLEDTRKWIPLDDDRMPTLAEHYKVPHFDSKGEADGFFAEAGAPTTYLATAFFWENLFQLVARGEDGVLAITIPMGDARLPGIAAKDVGPTAYGIFKRGDELIGSHIGIAGEHLRVAEMAATLSTVLGEEVKYVDVPADVFRSFGFPGADTWATCSSSSTTSRTTTSEPAICPLCGRSTRTCRPSRIGARQQGPIRGVGLERARPRHRRDLRQPSQLILRSTPEAALTAPSSPRRAQVHAEQLAPFLMPGGVLVPAGSSAQMSPFRTIRGDPSSISSPSIRRSAVPAARTFLTQSERGRSSDEHVPVRHGWASSGVRYVVPEDLPTCTSTGRTPRRISMGLKTRRLTLASQRGNGICVLLAPRGRSTLESSPSLSY